MSWNFGRLGAGRVSSPYRISTSCGIPTAFIINRDGVIAWIGHPMGLKEQVLDDIVSGRQDLAKARADYQKEFANPREKGALEKTLASYRDGKLPGAEN
jgi:hypothetical protein